MDEIQFKLRAAEKFLAKIPNAVPKNTREIEKLEENSGAFLFFASSIIEIIKRQINDEFEIFDKENVFYIHGIRKKHDCKILLWPLYWPEQNRVKPSEEYINFFDGIIIKSIAEKDGWFGSLPSMRFME